MRTWDLNSGAAKLEMALEALQEAAAASMDEWSDDSNRMFQEKYILPIEPRVRRAMEAFRALAEVLGRAQRACGSRDEVL
jgi:hypothetical protein